MNSISEYGMEPLVFFVLLATFFCFGVLALFSVSDYLSARNQKENEPRSGLNDTTSHFSYDDLMEELSAPCPALD